MSHPPAATAALPRSSSPPSKPQPSFFVRAMTIPAAIKAALRTVCSLRAMRFGVSQRRAITVRGAGASGCRMSVWMPRSICDAGTVAVAAASMASISLG